MQKCILIRRSKLHLLKYIICKRNPRKKKTVNIYAKCAHDALEILYIFFYIFTTTLHIVHIFVNVFKSFHIGIENISFKLVKSATFLISTYLNLKLIIKLNLWNSKHNFWLHLNIWIQNRFYKFNTKFMNKFKIWKLRLLIYKYTA